MLAPAELHQRRLAYRYNSINLGDKKADHVVVSPGTGILIPEGRPGLKSRSSLPSKPTPRSNVMAKVFFSSPMTFKFT